MPEVISSVRDHLDALKSGRALFVLGVAFAIISFTAPNSHAQDSTTLGAFDTSGSKGVITINQVAGVGNQETNNLLVVNNGVGHLEVDQLSTGDVVPATTVSAKITSVAGLGNSGLLQINQASGNGNQLANAAFIGISADALQPLSPVTLSQTRADSTGTVFSGLPFQGHATIDPAAFSGASGVVQIGQVAGNNNLTANVVSLRVTP